MSSGSLREDAVGKRFLCVNGGGAKLKLNRYAEWPWRAGVIRCASHLDSSDKELQFLVEFDDQPWESREWIGVYSDNYQLFLLESCLVLGSRPSTARGSLHPCLVFVHLLDKPGFFKSKYSRPVEFLNDSLLDFQDTSKLKPIRDWDPSINSLDTSSANERAVRAWAELQDGQRLLINTPSVLIGLRIKVYRAEGTTQWYTAVTTGYNDDTGEFTLIDDTVLEEHYEDPRLTQLKLLGDGVVESILKGENIGITPRRSRSSVGSVKVCQHYGESSLSRRRIPLPKKTIKEPQTPPAKRGRKRGRQPQSTPKKEEPISKKSKLKATLPSSQQQQQGEKSPCQSDIGRREEERSPSSRPLSTPKSTAPSASTSRSSSPNSNNKPPTEEEETPSPASSLPQGANKRRQEPRPFLPSLEKNASSSCPSSHGNKRKAVAIVRPQPQQTAARKEEDLKARFSLYDFHSDDSETEGGGGGSLHSASSSSTGGSSGLSPCKKTLKGNAHKTGNKSLSRPSKAHKARKEGPSSRKRVSQETGGRKTGRSEEREQRREDRSPSSLEAPKSGEECEEKVPPILKKEECEDGIETNGNRRDSDNSSSSSSSQKGAQLDETSELRCRVLKEEKLSGDETDEIKKSIIKTESTDNSCSTNNSNSRNSTHSSISSNNNNSASNSTTPTSNHNNHHHHHHNNNMGDHSPSPSSSGDRRLNPLSAAANLTALTAHYQAAALQQAGLSPHLLAQYHQSLAAAGIPPEVLLKQQAPPTGPPGSSYHHHHSPLPPMPLVGARNDYSLLAARERELAADRERIFRERAEAEARERERLDKERKEKERIERDRREREERRRNAEADFLKKQQAVEAVDQHFQLSMELAKKKMADAGQHWSQLPGITKEDRRKFEDSRHDAAAAVFRQQQQYINAMAANIGSSRCLSAEAAAVHPPKQGGLPYKAQYHLPTEPVVFKPYEPMPRLPSNSVSPVGGHSTPSPQLLTSPPPPPASNSFPRISQPPPAHGSTRPSTPMLDELPLDLGSKRIHPEPNVLEVMPPKKAGRFETLYKVSEPSVLPPEPAPSLINTVINKAVVGNTEEGLNLITNQTSNTGTSSPALGDSDEDFGYVHKLKKAWIKAYSEPNTAPPTPSHPPLKSSSFSNPPTPSRATPSPALSNHSGKSSSKTTNLNGHNNNSKKGGETSSSSDSESSSQHEALAQKRRGKKGGASKGRKAKANGSKKSSKARDSDSNLSESDKESNSLVETQQVAAAQQQPKKRGRKPRKESLEGLRKGSNSPLPLKVGGNPFSKPPIAQLKKTGESFLQDASCFEVAPKLAKCRECRWTQSQRNKKMPNIFCRFYAFRRLKFTKNGQLAVSGFCNPMRDASESDIAVWSVPGSKSKVDKEQALKVLKHLRSDFTTIMDQERAAQKAHMANDDTVAWKRVVQGVREMCDVCDATLFNFHWACSKCGFVVCVDCYLARKDDIVLRSWGDNDKERDRYSWLLCTNRQGHELEKLVLTQIIAGDALGKVEDLLSSSSPSPEPNGVKTPSSHALKHYVPKRRFPHHTTWKEEEGNPIGGNVLSLDSDEDALESFQSHWGSGNPVLIRHSQKLSSVFPSWEPQKLIDSFGDVKVELVEASSNNSAGLFPIKMLLSAFLDPEKTLKDDSGRRLYLKAKDWLPQGEEFAEAFPSRCNAFLNSLPLANLTDRLSPLNLASSLPDVFVRPDLGPRAWFVHGTPSPQDSGTINVHVDISDSLNVIVYSSEESELLKEEKGGPIFSDCEGPPAEGAVALWHVFHPSDADKIRDLLNKENKGDPTFDYLHEESKYLDVDLRAKLKNEYGVSPITLYQSPGEALLIPAGSPKQVRHLKCCIALSSDFVSAESLSHSFNMVQSMRYLSESQTIGEDKLQVKNLIFHSVKDALKALSASSSSSASSEEKS